MPHRRDRGCFNTLLLIDGSACDGQQRRRDEWRLFVGVVLHFAFAFFFSPVRDNSALAPLSCSRAAHTCRMLSRAPRPVIEPLQQCDNMGPGRYFRDQPRSRFAPPPQRLQPTRPGTHMLQRHRDTVKPRVTRPAVSVYQLSMWRRGVVFKGFSSCLHLLSSTLLCDSLVPHSTLHHSSLCSFLFHFCDSSLSCAQFFPIFFFPRRQSADGDAQTHDRPADCCRCECQQEQRDSWAGRLRS